MNRLVIQASTWAVLMLLAAADLAWHYPRLPQRMATHFDAAGAANGWGSRQSFLVASLVGMGVVLILGAGTGWLMRVIPVRFVNVPRRDFWLAPAREDWTRQAVADLTFALCVVIFLTLLAINHLVMRANLHPEPHLGRAPWYLLVAMFGAVACLIGASQWRFRRAARG